jgi:hydroxymethylbilane synthase
MHIKIGTRGSKLALWQAYHVEEKLKAAGAKTEVIIIHTKGDKIQDRSLSKIGSKGVFTEELEEQLLDGTIDIAVHSAKDLQSDLGDNFEIIAFLEREKVNDVLVSNKPVSIEDEIIIGTSSTRRIAMLNAFYPKAKIVDMRGNLQTRIAKMEKGDCDALLLAYAGVHRMEYHDLIQDVINEKVFTPAVGQGSVAIEASINLAADKVKLVRAACNHEETEVCLKTERAFLKTVNGGCSIPVFGLATMNQNQEIEFNAGIINLDGTKVLRFNQTGTNSEVLGEKVGVQLLENGGKAILADIRKRL